MDKKIITVLLVEDNEGDILLVRRMLANSSQMVEFIIESVQNLSDAIKCLSSDKKYDIVLLDMGLPDSSGIETVQKVRQANQYVPIVVLTGFDDKETSLLTIKNGATDYLVKDKLSKDLLIRTLNFAVERGQAEKAILRERNKAQSYLDVAGVIMLVLNDDLTVHRINIKGSEILGYAEQDICGKNWCDNFIPSEYREKVSQVLKNLLSGEIGKYEYHENPVLTKTGQYRLIAWHNSVLRDEAGQIKSILSSGEDITERKEAEEAIKKAYSELESANANLKSMQAQIIQNEKLASIGQLAAGVAHEMNTPVGFTASNFETLAKYFDKFKNLLDMYGKLAGEMPNIDKDGIIARTAEIRKTADDMKMDFILEDIGSLFEESKEGLQRVTTIIQNLRDFSRVDKIDTYDDFDIRRGMEATLAVARNTIKYNANVTLEFADVPQVPCNASQINQVFLNMLVNAAQAIESQQKEMGNIRIKIYPAEQYAVCEIEDDGPGIPQEYLNRVFEPFFTTKPAGKGTGLGLAVSYDIIVNKHKGALLIDSQVGRGTKFTIKLPLSRQNADAQKEMKTDGQENHIICG
jgi:PAS domain S-box-containing protein